MAKVSLVFHLTLSIAIFLCSVNCLPDIVRIGGLFDESDTEQKFAFQDAVKQINLDRSILSRSGLMSNIDVISGEDSFSASKKACNMLRTGVSSIFGPQSESVSSHVQSICNALKVPHLETRPDNRNQRQDYAVNLHPHPSALSEAFENIIDALGWMHYTIIHETNEGLLRLQAEHPSTIRQLPDSNDYKPLLKQIKESGLTHIVLDCSTDKIYDLLKQSHQIGMMDAYYSFLITSLDLQTIDLDEFKNSGAKITAFRLVDPDNELVKRVLQQRNETAIKTEIALIYDAVHIFVKALSNLDRIQNIAIPSLSCDRQDSWRHGYSLTNYIKAIEMKGLTNNIKFDKQGLRTDFVLDVIELNFNGIVRVGDWNPNQGVNFLSSKEEDVPVNLELKEKVFTVTAILGEPFLMRKDSAENITGKNEQFEGFALDLIEQISRLLAFNYTIRVVPDNQYGALNSQTGEWNGMIRELLEDRADIAIGGLTITHEREAAVDFSTPFMNLGISVLYRKPQIAPPNLFAFMSPFSLNAWIHIIIAYLGVSVLLFFLARFTEKSDDENSDKPESQFTLLNCFWFTMGSIMRQGCDFFPKATSTRMVAGMWWCFALIMITLYTANLMAFVTMERKESSIESIEDLGIQNIIKYGLLKGGSTESFFRNSKNPMIQRMWSVMESNPTVFTSSNNEGINRVLEGNGEYAFLMESSVIKYTTQRHCDLSQIGGLLDSKGYGIATKPNAPYQKMINTAILRLQEDATLDQLVNKWWIENNDGPQCIDSLESDEQELSFHNVHGVFLVLIIGLIIACIIAACEFAWKSRSRDAKKEYDIQMPRLSN